MGLARFALRVLACPANTLGHAGTGPPLLTPRASPLLQRGVEALGEAWMFEYGGKPGINVQVDCLRGGAPPTGRHTPGKGCRATTRALPAHAPR